MTSTLPQFIFPTMLPGGYNYNYNDVDSVNVSWSWNKAPDDASVSLVFWAPNTGNAGTLTNRTWDSGIGTSSYKIVSLKIPGVTYPVVGHWELFADFENRTLAEGPNSQSVTMEQSSSGPECRNCSQVASTSISSAVSTHTNTSGTGAVSPDVTVTVSATPPPESTSNSLSGGAIAGIVIGIIAAIGLAGAIGWWLLHRRRVHKPEASGADNGARLGESESAMIDSTKTPLKDMSVHEVYGGSGLGSLPQAVKPTELGIER